MSGRRESVSGPRGACVGKIPFSSFYAADKAARNAIKRDSNRQGKHYKGTKLEPYRCKFCDSWHLGHRLKG